MQPRDQCAKMCRKDWETAGSVTAETRFNIFPNLSYILSHIAQIKIRHVPSLGNCPRSAACLGTGFVCGSSCNFIGCVLVLHCAIFEIQGACLGNERHTLGFLVSGFWAGRKSPSGMVCGTAGAAQTQKQIDDVRPAPNHALKTQV